MARHMMQRDMFHNDMAANHAAVSYYAGTSSIFWGFIGTPILPPDTKRRL